MSGPCEEAEQAFDLRGRPRKDGVVTVLLLCGLKPHRELCGKSMGNIETAPFGQEAFARNILQIRISNSFVTFVINPPRLSFPLFAAYVSRAAVLRHYTTMRPRANAGVSVSPTSCLTTVRDSSLR